ncbi:nucleotidyltransferase family protein [Shewanella sp. AC91-MNA-CIBAN-0169]|uniref:nucleotidyltransferase family protein n=1 Tax=Shewanella sp. AC91-MNA-CIBAN-0169 TaxID=3140466 RepID=UPI00332732F2
MGRFLLLCYPDMTAKDLCDNFSDQHFDEDTLKWLINRHRVWNIVAKNVTKLDADFFSSEFCHWLKVANERCKQKTLLQLSVQTKLSLQFDELGIKYRFFKGIDLSQRLYSDISARFSHDIDLLVDPSDVIKAENVLLSFGYHPLYGLFSDTDKASLLLKIRVKDKSYQGVNSPLLELHTRVGNVETEFTHEVAHMLLNESETLNTIEYLYLCFHAMRSSCHRIKWLVDIANYYLVMDKQSDCWHQDKWRLAKKFGLTKHVIVIESLMMTCFGIPTTSKSFFGSKRYENWILKSWSIPCQGSGGYLSLVVWPFYLEGSVINKLIMLKDYCFGISHADRDFINRYAIRDGKLVSLMLPIKKLTRLLFREKD